jgi:hypothetical protein
MAENTERQQDSWTQGMTNIREAVEHNMTASRLVATGAIALGAAATAYFWDPQRRSAFMESSRRLTEDMTGWWSGMYSGSGTSGTTTGGATTGGSR